MIRAVDWATDKADERERKGKNRTDPYIAACAQGIVDCEYVRTEKLDLDNDKSPCIFRGLGKSPLIHKCIEKGIDFYYIDTGYYGNFTTKKWHRVSKNNLQTLNHIPTDEIFTRLFGKVYGDKQVFLNNNDGKKIPRAFHHKESHIFHNRFDGMGLGSRDNQRYTRRERSNRILLVPPSQKVFNHFGGSAEEWTENFLKEAPKYTTKEIILRPKVGRSDRQKFSLQTQLIKEGFDSLITFNSIASLEGILKGFPATTLGPNAGAYLSNNFIENINDPKYPTDLTIQSHLFYLSLGQFTIDEIANGWAFKVVNQLQYDQKPNSFKLGPHTGDLY